MDDLWCILLSQGTGINASYPAIVTNSVCRRIFQGPLMPVPLLLSWRGEWKDGYADATKWCIVEEPLKSSSIPWQRKGKERKVCCMLL